MVIEDEDDGDDDHDLVVLVSPGGVDRESMGEARSSEMVTSSASDSGSTTSDPPSIKVKQGNMNAERIEELVLRYGVPSNYICRIPSIDEYGSMPGPLEIGMCEEIFKVGFRILIHAFIEELLHKCRLVLAQIHPNA